jgi:diaminopimelate decarboxylase
MQVNIISEPGRYFSAASTVLCANVIGRRDRVAEAEGDPTSTPMYARLID